MKFKENFLEQLVNSFVVDRLADVYAKDEEYQKRLTLTYTQGMKDLLALLRTLS